MAKKKVAKKVTKKKVAFLFSAGTSLAKKNKIIYLQHGA